MSPLGWAIETAEVLPKGVRNLRLQMGQVGGLNQQYSESGQLQNLADLNTISLDVSTLTTIDASVTELVNILNQFGPDNLGDQLFLGNLSVNASPNLRYYAPIFAWGISNKHTLGIAIPIMEFKNSVKIGLANSNFEALRAEFEGASDELDAAFEQLNLDMRSEFKAKVASAGYKPIEDKNETFIGDIQLVSAYQFVNKPKQLQTLRVYLNLPTGPEPDADDLTDIEIFHRTAITPTYLATYKINKRTNLFGILSYNYVFPSEVEKRVPLDEDDQLPEANQKRTLDEQIGATASASLGATWEHSSSFVTSLAYTREEKEADRYSQSDIGDSSLLSRGTKSSANIGTIELAYSTVSLFRQKKVSIPYTASIEFSSVLSGTNIENQSIISAQLGIFF